ncbi:MAG: LacI family DNA-binding transcriptional regulator [Bacteroidota bacterium]
MKKNIRIKDIAEKAGVSVGTVDRVLHNRGEVSVVTKEKILSIVKELDYHPNILARALTSKKIYTFAVLIPSADNSNSYWTHPLKGIHNAEHNLKDYNIKIEKFFFNQNSKKEFQEQFKNLIKLNPQGVLLAPIFSDEVQKFTAKLLESDIPFVFINSDKANSKRLCFIGQDDFQSGMVASKLASINLSNNDTILVVHITKDYKSKEHFVNRNNGFLHYFKEKSQKIIQVELKDNFTHDFDEIFALNPSIRSIYVLSSKVYKVAEYLKANSLKHIQLIGYDLIKENIGYLNQEYIDFLISQNSEKQGYRAINYLFKAIVKNETVPKQDLMPIDIITKENVKYYVSSSEKSKL